MRVKRPVGRVEWSRAANRSCVNGSPNRAPRGRQRLHACPVAQTAVARRSDPGHAPQPRARVRRGLRGSALLRTSSEPGTDFEHPDRTHRIPRSERRHNPVRHRVLGRDHPNDYSVVHKPGRNDLRWLVATHPAGISSGGPLDLLAGLGARHSDRFAEGINDASAPTSGPLRRQNPRHRPPGPKPRWPVPRARQDSNLRPTD